MYKYKVMAADSPEASVEQLDEFGKDGWLLVQIMKIKRRGWVFWFVKEIKTP